LLVRFFFGGYRRKEKAWQKETPQPGRCPVPRQTFCKKFGSKTSLRRCHEVDQNIF
jgi:hypothetical protein